jgi:hypothetical protein
MIKRKAQTKPSKAREWFSKKIKKITGSDKPKNQKQDPDAVVASQHQQRPHTASVSAAEPPAGLSVTVAIQFQHPLNTIYTYQYNTSPSFRANDRVAHRLLRHIHHNSYELVTRKDRVNDPVLEYKRRIKLAQYHVSYRIERDGQKWAERYFTSFQEDTVSPDESRRIVLEVDHIVALFLHQVDHGFRWSVPEGIEDVQPKDVPSPSAPTRALVGLLQGDPGYFIELSVRGLGPSGEHERLIRVDSLQGSPLTLTIAETLMTRINGILLQAVEDHRVEFEEQHDDCEGFDGSSGCKHLREGSFDMMVSVKNTHGPDLPRLTNRIRSFWILFDHDRINVLDDFMDRLHVQLEEARQQSDESVNNLEEFILEINELRTEDWILHRPLTVTLDSSVTDGHLFTDGRGTAEAIVQRVQAGIKFVFHGHGVSATLTAHKRGHLILDTLIHGGDDYADDGQEPLDSPWLNHEFLQSKLTKRIREDIEAVCRDASPFEDPFKRLNLSIITPNNVPQNLHSDLLEERLEPDDEAFSVESRTVMRKPEHVDLRRLSHDDKTSKASVADVDVEAQNDDDDDSEIGHDDALNQDGYSTPSTPSLVDTDSVSPRDYATTPPSKQELPPRIQSLWWNSGINIVSSEHSGLSEGSMHSHALDDENSSLRKGPSKQFSDVSEPQVTQFTALTASNEIENPFVAQRHEFHAQEHVKRGRETSHEGALPHKRRKASGEAEIESEEAEEQQNSVLKEFKEPQGKLEQVSEERSITVALPVIEEPQLPSEELTPPSTEVQVQEEAAIFPAPEPTSSPAVEERPKDAPVHVGLLLRKSNVSENGMAKDTEETTQQDRLQTKPSSSWVSPEEALERNVAELRDQVSPASGELETAESRKRALDNSPVQHPPKAKDLGLRVKIPRDDESLDGVDESPKSQAPTISSPNSPPAIFSFPLPPSPSPSQGSIGSHRRGRPLSFATTGPIGFRESRIAEMDIRNILVPSHLRLARTGDSVVSILAGSPGQ